MGVRTPMKHPIDGASTARGDGKRVLIGGVGPCTVPRTNTAHPKLITFLNDASNPIVSKFYFSCLYQRSWTFVHPLSSCVFSLRHRSYLSHCLLSAPPETQRLSEVHACARMLRVGYDSCSSGILSLFWTLPRNVVAGFGEIHTSES